MMGKKLNTQEEAFKRKFLLTANVVESALYAKYAPSTAKTKAFTWVSDSKCPKNKRHLLEAINKAKSERSERTKIDSDWLLNRLALEAEADVADLYAENGGLLPVHQWPEIWRKGLVSGIDTHQEYVYKDGKKIPDGVTMKVKLSERVKRLELIGRHVDVQAFKDQVDHSGQVSAIMPVPSCTSVEDWEKQAQEQQTKA